MAKSGWSLVVSTRTLRKSVEPGGSLAGPVKAASELLAENLVVDRIEPAVALRCRKSALVPRGPWQCGRRNAAGASAIGPGPSTRHFMSEWPSGLIHSAQMVELRLW
jgi:hypothetical protein